MPSLHFASTLAASREAVWQRVRTMRGVNDELAPWLRMTAPSALQETPLEQAPTGTLLFRSWICLLGVLPIDRHAFQLEEVEAGRGFVECSCSWSERVWQHRRTLAQEGEACRLEDTLTFEPRFPLTTPVITAVVRVVFHHRHARLRERFGVAQSEQCPSGSGPARWREVSEKSP